MINDVDENSISTLTDFAKEDFVPQSQNISLALTPPIHTTSETPILDARSQPTSLEGSAQFSYEGVGLQLSSEFVVHEMELPSQTTTLAALPLTMTPDRPETEPLLQPQDVVQINTPSQPTVSSSADLTRLLETSSSEPSRTQRRDNENLKRMIQDSRWDRGVHQMHV